MDIPYRNVLIAETTGLAFVTSISMANTDDAAVLVSTHNLGWSSQKYVSLLFDLSHQSEQSDWLRI